MRAMVAARGQKGKAFGRSSVPLAPGFALTILFVLVAAGCSSDTSRLDAARARHFQAEGIVRHAENIAFRYTEGAGTSGSSWEDRLGSIVVTRQTILIHKNEKIGLEIAPGTRKVTGVERRGQRIRIRVGRGRSAEIWSFVAPDDAEGWAHDLRAVMKPSAPE
jgi:hypothetical protein